MRQRPKMNLLISSTAMVGSLLVILYLIMVMPQRLDLIVTFGIIALADNYFLMDGILKRIDDISNDNLDKQSEIAKVEKGIYSIAKREESAMAERTEELARAIQSLQADNERLNQELIEQQKLFTKVSMKKSQESYAKLINGNDRVAKLLVQLTSNNNTVSTETLELLSDIATALDAKKKEEILHSNVTKMPPRAE